MKAFFSFLAASLLVLATASADWVIESKIESSQLNANTTTKVKGDKLRVDIPNGPIGAMSSIVDATTGDTVTLVHTQKMAMKTSGAQLKAAMELAKQTAGLKGGAKAAPQATGQKEKVGDYDCEIYTWTDGNSSSKVWIASNHPQAAALKALEKQMRTGVLGGIQSGPDMSAIPGVALKTEATVQGQKVTTTILSVKEEAIDAKEFEVPADYKSMALPGGAK